MLCSELICISLDMVDFLVTTSSSLSIRGTKCDINEKTITSIGKSCILYVHSIAIEHDHITFDIDAMSQLFSSKFGFLVTKNHNIIVRYT